MQTVNYYIQQHWKSFMRREVADLGIPLPHHREYPRTPGLMYPWKITRVHKLRKQIMIIELPFPNDVRTTCRPIPVLYVD